MPTLIDRRIDRLADVTDGERQCLPERRCFADALGQQLAACFGLVLGALPGHLVKPKVNGIFDLPARGPARNMPAARA